MSQIPFSGDLNRINKEGVFKIIKSKLLNISLDIAEKKDINQALSNINKLINDVGYYAEKNYSVVPVNKHQKLDNIDK